PAKGTAEPLDDERLRRAPALHSDPLDPRAAQAIRRDAAGRAVVVREIGERLNQLRRRLLNAGAGSGPAGRRGAPRRREPDRFEQSAEHLAGIEVLAGNVEGGAGVAVVIGVDRLERRQEVFYRAERE